MSTERLRGLFELDLLDRTLRVSSGFKLWEVNERLAEHGLQLGAVGAVVLRVGLPDEGRAGPQRAHQGVFATHEVEVAGPEQVVEVARVLREEHDFRGYIHLKTIPDASPELLARAGSDEIKARLRDQTAEARARGIFGAPTFFVGPKESEEMHFGQDRLDFVEEALMRA